MKYSVERETGLVGPRSMLSLLSSVGNPGSRATLLRLIGQDLDVSDLWDGTGKGGSFWIQRVGVKDEQGRSEA